MNYNDTIDTCTVWMWEKALAGDYTVLRVVPDEGDHDNDVLAWERLYDGYIKKYGLGKTYQRIIELKMQIAELQCEFAISGNLYLTNEIGHLEDDLINLLNRPTQGSIDDCIYILSRHMQFRIDKKVISLEEFQSYLNGYEKEVAEYRNRKGA